MLWPGQSSAPSWAPQRRAGGDPLSKQDAHFFNIFAAVIAMVAVVVVGIYILSRVVARHTQNQRKLSETAYGDNVRGGIGSPG